eukprot:CAMPEP_0184868872 /NCGR_PEP_ID=MMETSP0580-20130426/32008_1 /TAXON_ID=1118495 /ORGANISM="Dactyliosolen fragilissimus" /LENGTH=54 /DNA_ID=CAMNT_0027370027 /DNA_START=62 /DNA_END=223 /DNA_ORIENTATION=+
MSKQIPRENCSMTKHTFVIEFNEVMPTQVSRVHLATEESGDKANLATQDALPAK